MNDKQASETKGLLLIDGAYNTLLIPFNSDEMKDLTEHFIKDNLKYVRRNKKKSDLDQSIRLYLKKEYVNEENGGLHE